VPPVCFDFDSKPVATTSGGAAAKLNATSTCVLFTVAARRKAGTLRTPEDARYGGNAGEGTGLTGSSGSTASEAEQRWQRIMLNDLEVCVCAVGWWRNLCGLT